MMMPANFSAVSENEMTYVMGGASLADYLAPVMETAQWQKFSKNMVNLIGKKYLDTFLSNPLGVVFSGAYIPGQSMNAFGSELGNIWAQNYGKPVKTQDKILKGLAGVLNVGLNIAGNLAAIYNLGFGDVKNAAADTKGFTTPNFG